MAHPVVRALHERPAGARIAVVIEGGGMRGSVSGGMSLALDELGLADSFDAAYGSSAGALNAMWLVSGRVREGMPTWIDPQLVYELIEPKRALRRQPVVDLTTLIDTRYQQLVPGLFEAVLRAGTELHPLATEVATARSVDLHPEISDEESLRLALRASATIPLLAGPPVEFRGRRLVDAGVAAAIPFRAAIEDGATHVLILRSRRHGDRVQPPGRMSGLLTARLLRRISPAVEQSFLSRVQREHEDEDFLDACRSNGHRAPYILAIHPPPGSPVPSRLERDIGLVREANQAGREAALEALAPAS